MESCMFFVKFRGTDITCPVYGVRQDEDGRTQFLLRIYDMVCEIKRNFSWEWEYADGYEPLEE